MLTNPLPDSGTEPISHDTPSASPGGDALLTPYARATIHYKARRLIGRFGFTPQDLPDLEQDLTLDLLRRAHAFDPAKAQWSTFLSRCIDHRIYDLIRAQCTTKRHHERRAALSDADAETAPTYAQRSGADVAHRDLKIDVAAALARLPVSLRQLCVRLATQSISSIAAEDGRSRWFVYQDIARIRSAFRAAGINSTY